MSMDHEVTLNNYLMTYLQTRRSSYTSDNISGLASYNLSLIGHPRHAIVPLKTHCQNDQTMAPCTATVAGWRVPASI